MPKSKRGPKGQRLEPGISWDPGKLRYRLRYTDENDKWRNASGGKNLEKARRKLKELNRGERSEESLRSMTFAECVDLWAAHKARTARRNIKRERNQLDLHVDPVLGHRRLADIRPKDIVNLCWDCYDSGLSAASVTKNLKSTINSVFEHAVFEELCEYNPCASIPNGKLPKLGDNRVPGFDRHEVESLLRCPDISEDRRMFYMLATFLGLRLGEAAGLRWTDWDRTLQPLGGMQIDSQYQDQPLKGSRDDYVAARRVPVHPMLHAALVAWRVEGFARVYRRAPGDGDFIVPQLPPNSRRARTESIVGKALTRDHGPAGVTKIDGRNAHGFRKALATLACEDGAPESVVRTFTHTGKTRDVFDRYRQWSWETCCDAVQCLTLNLDKPGQVLSVVRE